MDDELKWLTPRKSWKYIPNRYQALTAQIVAALLYFNLFDVLFKGKNSSSGACGSLVRPVLEGANYPIGSVLASENYPIGWIWNILGDFNQATCPRMMAGLFQEFFFTVLALAICGLVLRKAIKRMPAEHREATKDL